MRGQACGQGEGGVKPPPIKVLKHRGSADLGAILKALWAKLSDSIKYPGGWLHIAGANPLDISELFVGLGLLGLGPLVNSVERGPLCFYTSPIIFPVAGPLAFPRVTLSSCEPFLSEPFLSKPL